MAVRHVPSCCERKLVVPLESLQGNQALSLVEGNSLLFQLVVGNLGFLLSCDDDLRIPLKWQ